MLLLGAVVVLTIQAFVINRLAGLQQPLARTAGTARMPGSGRFTLDLAGLSGLQ